MSLDNIIAITAALLLAWQIRESAKQTKLLAQQVQESTKQQQLQAFVKIYDTNRELICLGFQYPELFDILADAENVDPVKERRYLQLWLNDFAVTHLHIEESVFKEQLKESLKRDLSFFMPMKNMQRHWEHFSSFYTESFQEMVNDILKSKRNNPPLPAPNQESKT